MRSLTVAAAGSLLLVAAEVVVFVVLAHVVGWGWAVLAGLVTTVLGAVLAKRAGMRAWRAFRASTASGAFPAGGEVADGLTRFLAAVLLLMPGFLTDAAGLLLLLPPVRHVTARQVRGYAERRISPAAAGGLFGPRVVRATRGDTVTGGHARDVVEGDIVDP